MDPKTVGIILLLVVFVGPETRFNVAQCRVIFSNTWHGRLLEKVCCQGKLYLRQDDTITAQDGECEMGTKVRSGVVTTLIVMFIRLLM